MSAVSPFVLGIAIYTTRRHDFCVDLRDGELFVDGFHMQSKEFVEAAFELIDPYGRKSSALWDRLKTFHPEWARKLSS